MKKTFNKNEDAVSPVIGVMLMLVITVILAAAVSSTSSGLMKSSSAAPTATFDVAISKNATGTSYFQIKEITGDSIPTKDLKIVVNVNGAVNETLPAPTSLDSDPYLNNPSKGTPGTDLSVSFGNYTLMPGAAMFSDSTDNILRWDNISKGDFVKVTMIHLPSQKVILDTDVEVI